MRVRPAALAVCAAASLAGGAALATEPKQPATAEEIVEYRESGEWDADITRVTDRATAYLRSHLEDARKPAMVLDVDDTSLSSYDCLKAADFDRDVVGDACPAGGEMPAIAQTLALFRFARAEGVSVFFITGRRARLRAATVSNLRAEGFGGTWSLRLRPNRQPRSQRSGWKARVRRELARRGYTVVANVGDQWSDLRGGGAMRTFKLPNPMYTIPVA
ncbi:MAG TPA: HAD family acid phosphatase [Solirubrobacteraceae bacterium]|jgi:predicted secreted acid phosphatase